MPSPTDNTAVLAARAEMVALCNEFESWLRHPGNAQAEDAAVEQWTEGIALKARRYASLLQGQEPAPAVEFKVPPSRHLHSVTD